VSKRIQKTRFKRAGFLFAIKRLISYVWPITIATTSQKDEYLELILYKGSIQLNSRNANYSYGNLQIAFRKMFNEEELPWNSINQVLVLGFGLGGVCDLIQNHRPKAKIIGVEKNSHIQQWHLEFFHRIGVELYVDDAEDFLNGSKLQFDLIVVDVYQDLNVPAHIESDTFVGKLHDALNKGGIVIFNKVVNNDEQKDQFASLLSFFSKQFKKIRVNHQMKINRIIIANKT
jgi:spermidine synthase